MGVQRLQKALKTSKGTLPPRNDVAKFDVKTNTKELENNLKLQGCPSNLQDKFKEVVTYYMYMF